MTRDEIRTMIDRINSIARSVASRMQESCGAEYLAFALVTPPNPEPDYWDYLPHLTDACEDDDMVSDWTQVLRGNYKQKICDVCGQLAWERMWFLEAHSYGPGGYGSGEEFLTGELSVCLPCVKAGEEPGVGGLREPYELQFVWDMSTIIPSQGVFTLEWFRRKDQEEREELQRRFPPKTQQEFEADVIAEHQAFLQRLSPEKRRKAQGRPVMIRGVTVDMDAEGNVFVVPDSAERFARMAEYIHRLTEQNFRQLSHEENDELPLPDDNDSI
jgi:hypothetical protein